MRFWSCNDQGAVWLSAIVLPAVKRCAVLFENEGPCIVSIYVFAKTAQVDEIGPIFYSKAYVNDKLQ